MRAYKGFNKDLVCTMGNGDFQYEIGKEYTEETAQCARTGFHCCAEPIEVLKWYHNKDSRYCVVEISGDIHEDGTNKISATTMKIVREVTREQLAMLEVLWIMENPDRETSTLIQKERGMAAGDGIVIVRGKDPKAKGEEGDSIFLIKETKKGRTFAAYKIDGKERKAGVFYNIKGVRR